jgi:hypothetical protein
MALEEEPSSAPQDARRALESLPELPRLSAAPAAKAAASSLEAQIERRRQLTAARAG